METLYTKSEILSLVTDELRQVNKALKVGGNLALTDTDFQYIGTIMCALKEKERIFSQRDYNVEYLGIGA